MTNQELLDSVRDIVKDVVHQELEQSDFMKKDDLRAFENRLNSKFATKDDLNAFEERMRSEFTTKDDLNAFETRMEGKFSTKDDLNEFENRMENKFATKDDLKELATKEDIRRLDGTLTEFYTEYRKDMGQLKAQVGEMAIDQTALKGRVRVLEHPDQDQQYSPPQKPHF